MRERCTGHLPYEAQAGGEDCDERGRDPDPLQLTAQNLYTPFREESAQRDRRNANRTPGKEIPPIVEGGEEGYPYAATRQGVQEAMGQGRQAQESGQYKTHMGCWRRLHRNGEQPGETGTHEEGEDNGVRQPAMPQHMPIGHAEPEPHDVEIRQDRTGDAEHYYTRGAQLIRQQGGKG
jgi:hypothetical protein